LFRRVFTVLATVVYDFWDNLIVAVTANLIWSLFLIPPLLVGLLPLASPFGLMLVLLVLGLTIGIPTIGLFNMTTDMRREERLEIADFWRGMKQFWKRGLGLMLLNSGFFIIVYANIFFYANQFAGTPVVFLSVIWLYLGAMWLIMQMYVWTQAVRGDEFKLKQIFRNALLATFKYSQFSLPLGIIYFAVLIGLAFVIGVIPIIFAGGIMFAMLGNRAWNAILERENQLAERNKASGSEN
jgi:hypothetical protein